MAHDWSLQLHVNEYHHSVINYHRNVIHYRLNVINYHLNVLKMSRAIIAATANTVSIASKAADLLSVRSVPAHNKPVNHKP